MYMFLESGSPWFLSKVASVQSLSRVNSKPVVGGKSCLKLFIETVYTAAGVSEVQYH